MDEPERFQLLVVAGGKGGKTLAMEMARAGWTVAMIERGPEMFGGTCINSAISAERIKVFVGMQARFIG
jgi:pyruvate/2-oxoglutarate dehydrogenase complex dihydrolipoamide dehydrogenase (E3) component